MTLILAGLILLTLPVFISLLRTFPRRRHWAYAALAALPLMSNLPLTGFLYGWGQWNGTVRGFGVSVVVVLASALIVTRPRVSGVYPFLVLFAIYGLALVISVFSSKIWLATVFVWWQLASILIVFLAVAGEGSRPEVRSSIMIGFAVGLVYQCIYALPQKLSGVLQAAGTFAHQNILGLAVELTMIPLLAAALAGDRRKIVLAGVLAGLACIAGSGSRGSMAIIGGAVLLLCLLSLIRRPTPRKWSMISLGVIALIVATPFAISTLNARFNGGSFVTSDPERIAYEKLAREMSRDYPFGVGANQFILISNQEGYASRFGISWQGSRSVPVHNAYLLARAETGWIGEIAFILILIVPILRALQLAYRDRRSRGGEYMLGASVAIIANLLHNNYEFATHTFEIQLLLFINIAMIAAQLRSWRFETQRSQARRMRAASPLAREGR